MENKVLAEQIKNLKDIFEKFIDENKDEHKLIIDQTTKTNGRVRSLEIWRAYLVGGWVVLTGLLATVAAIASNINWQ